jgi:hypothetical protein
MHQTFLTCTKLLDVLQLQSDSLESFLLALCAKFLPMSKWSMLPYLPGSLHMGMLKSALQIAHI